MDAALVRVPPEAVMGVAKALLQNRIPMMECARRHGEALLAHKSGIHRAALHHRARAARCAFLLAGAYSLLDLPPAALWGERRAAAEKNGCKHVF